MNINFRNSEKCIMYVLCLPKQNVSNISNFFWDLLENLFFF